MTEAERAFRNDYAEVISLPVQWGEMDALNHVNNVVYLRWFESARIAYLERAGFMSFLEGSNIGPILASSSVRYRIPIEFPDTVLIGASAQSCEASNLIQRYGVFSQQKQLLATTGEARVVMYDFNQKSKTAISDELLQNIQTLELSAGQKAIC